MIGALCGAGASLSWAVGFVAALHGIRAGLAPADLALHRYIWAGVIFLPFVFRAGWRTPGGMSWPKGLALTLFAGPLLAIFSYSGFLHVPLGHGAVIQPSSAAIGGLLLTTIFLHEPLQRTRVLGALAIVFGLVIYGGEAVNTIGRSGLLGDLSFAAAGISWAIFGLLLSLWRIEPVRAALVITVVSLLIFVPIHAVMFGFDRIMAAGLAENAMQIVVQGVFAGAGAIYLFARAVALLGAGRAAVFPALVPGFTLMIGYLVLGEVPTSPQLLGLVVVAVGFALVLKR